MPDLKPEWPYKGADVQPKAEDALRHSALLSKLHTTICKPQKCMRPCRTLRVSLKWHG